ncbi:MAG: hypothetical protein K8M05_39050 [Deltaproteobacteria bacterium]|nr:hypothetical protein [Kofleriaceae bacterium]
MSRALASIVVVLLCAFSAAHAQAAEVTLTIAGADKVTLTLPAGDTPTLAWKQTYYVYVDGAAAPVAIDASVPKLQDAAGRQLDVTSAAEQGSPATVTLTATIDKPGTYTTSLRVAGGGKVATKAITVEVAAAPAVSAPAPVEVLVQVDKGAKQLEDGDWPWPAKEDRDVILTVRNTTAAAVQANAALVAMTRKTAAGHAVDVATTLTHVDGARAGAPITVPRTSTARVKLTFDRLDSPGHYEGVVRLTPTDPAQKPVDLGFEIFLRHGWWLCALLIAIGAIAAYLVRNYQDRRRTAELRRIELAAIAERLAAHVPGAVTERALALGRVLHLHVRGLRDRIDRGDDPGAGATSSLELLARRVALYGRFVEVDATIARLPPATREAKRTALDGVAAVIGNEQADEGAIKKGGADLDGINARDAERKHLEAWLGALAADVASHAAAGDVELARGIASEIEPALDMARDAARRDDHAALSATLDRAHRSLIALGAAALERALKTAPGGVALAAWNQLTAELTPKLAELRVAGELDTLVANYAAIRTAYLVAVARGAIVVADEHVKDAAPARAQQLSALKDAVAAAVNATPAQAATVLRTTAALREALRADGVQIAARGEAYRPAEIAGKPRREPEGFTLARTSEPVSTDWRSLQARLRATDLAVTALVTFIAILAGLKLLWVSNATWGGAVDVLTAVVWGAGVNVTKDGFMGLLKLRSDLGKA